MRVLALAMLCVLLGACTRDPYVSADGETRSGDWYIAHQIDRVTGAELPSALIYAWASNTNEEFPRPSQFQLTCLDGKPVIRFAFKFKVGNDRDSVLGYRFDDRPGHENVESRVLRVQQILIVEEPAAVAQFMGELPGSKVLYMRIRSMLAGRTSAEYALTGSEAAVQAAFANCPMPVLPGKKTSLRSPSFRGGQRELRANPEPRHA